MAIDINQLRRLAQAALAGPDGISLNWIKLLQDFQEEANPTVIIELLDRLEAAESECLEEARLNGMGAERELALMAKLEAAEKERDALRAKIAEMEKQEPIKYECRRKPKNDVTWGLWKQCFKSDTARWGSKTSYEDEHFSYEVRALYAIPGAKGEEK